MKINLLLSCTLFAGILLFSHIANSATDSEPKAPQATTPASSAEASWKKEFNIKYYNAKGDGITDDYDAIRAAMDDASKNKNNGRVFFPAGTYLIRQPLVIETDLKLLGEGGLAVIKAGRDMYSMITIKQKNKYRNVNIEGITFDGGAKDQFGIRISGAALDIESIVNTVIDNLVFKNINGTALRTKKPDGDEKPSTSWNGLFSNVKIEVVNPNDYAVILTWGDHLFHSFDISGGKGTYVHQALCSRLVRFKFKNSSQNGLTLFQKYVEFGMPLNSMADCIFEGNKGYGLSLISNSFQDERNTYMTITDCVFDNNLTGDLYLDNFKGLLLNGNEFRSKNIIQNVKINSQIDKISFTDNKFACPKYNIEGACMYNNDFDCTSWSSLYDKYDNSAPRFAHESLLPNDKIIKSIVDFGAINGKNSSVAIQKAIDESPAGGIVYIPSGIYYIDMPVKLKNGVSIVGDGHRNIKSVLRAVNDMDSMIASPDDSGLSNISLANLVVMGAGRKINRGIELNNSHGITLQNLSVLQFSDYCVSIGSTSSKIHIINCAISNSNKANININGSDVLVISSLFGNRIGGSNVYTNGDNVLIDSLGGGNKVIGCLMDHTAHGYAVHITGNSPKKANVIECTNVDYHDIGAFAVDFEKPTISNTVIKGCNGGQSRNFVTLKNTIGVQLSANSINSNYTNLYYSSKEFNGFYQNSTGQDILDLSGNSKFRFAGNYFTYYKTINQLNMEEQSYGNIMLHAPYNKTPFEVPGKIEAEHFDMGGHPISCNIIDKGGAKVFRKNNELSTDITTDGESSGYDIILTCSNNDPRLNISEYAEYTINAKYSGLYDINVRLWRNPKDKAGRIRMIMKDKAEIRDVDIPNKGNSWQTITIPMVMLEKGCQIIRLGLSECTLAYPRTKINWLEFTKKADLSELFKSHIQIAVNGKILNYSDSHPILYNSNIYIPLQPVLATLGLHLTVNELHKTFTVETQNNEIISGIGIRRITINGITKILPDDKLTPFQMGKITYIPLSFVNDYLQMDASITNNIITIEPLNKKKNE